jgi:hypothetical protein
MRGLQLDGVARGDFGVFNAEGRVFALQCALVLERTPDAGVELQEAELHRDDPDQREGDEPDPSAAVDQAVEQGVRGDDRRRVA